MKYIIAADDEPTNLLIIEEALMDDYEVMTVENGLECLSEIKKRIPDILLLDVSMPEMDGIMVCQRLKEDPKTKYIPIIMLSGFASNDDIKRGLEAGADRYITKPFKPTILRNAISEMIEP